MTHPSLKSEIFRCECHTPTHHMFVTYDTVEDEILIELKLNELTPWWKRLYIAMLYILGRDASHLTQYEDIILGHPDRQKLAKMLLSKPKKEKKNVRNSANSPSLPNV